MEESSHLFKKARALPSEKDSVSLVSRQAALAATLQEGARRDKI